MHIKHITVKNFRCFEHLEFDLNPDVNIFVGNNGSGKSAVLDAIAAATFPYIKDIQLIVEKETDDIPFFPQDFPVTQKDDQKTITQFFISTNDLTGWHTTYGKPTNNDDTRLNRLSFGHSYSYGKESFDSQLKSRFNLKQRNKIFDLSVIAYYKGSRNLSNEINLKNITA
jgi:predicted ATP-binding protein involved in virulence